MTRPDGARNADVDHLAWLARYEPVAWQGRRVLDLGCGSGFLCAEAKRHGAVHVVGVDILKPDVAGDWLFRTLDLEGDKWPDEVPRASAGAGFDYIFAFDILEHLSSPVRFLAGCRSLLDAGGKLVLTTPNTNSWERLAKPAHWSGATDPQHRVLFNPYSLRFLMERQGFALRTLKAPMRKLESMGLPSPQIGAQIFCVAARGP